MRLRALGHDDSIGLYHDCIALVDEFVPDYELAIQALSLAVKHQHPAHDMLIVALVPRSGCSLFSVDSQLIAIARKIVATPVRN